jgi:hypothetical protein
MLYAHNDLYADVSNQAPLASSPLGYLF